MLEQNVTTAKIFYQAYDEKNISVIEQYLHPDIHYLAPLGESSGKESFLVAVKRFLGIIKKLKIRTAFGSGDQVILIYDLHFGEPETICRTAVLMNFKDGLISRLELFYDARPFVNK